MNVGDDGNLAAAGAQFRHDGLQVGRVLDGRRGNANDLAADGDEFEGLSHALGRVHRVAGEHRLHHDGMAAAEDDAAARGIADDHLAGLAAVMDERRVTIAHEPYFDGRGAGLSSVFSCCSIWVSRLNIARKSEMRLMSKKLT